MKDEGTLNLHQGLIIENIRLMMSIDPNALYVTPLLSPSVMILGNELRTKVKKGPKLKD